MPMTSLENPQAINKVRFQMPGRMDVHAHLLPGIDDGCETVDESIQCARMMVEAGYSHLICTPHVWPSLPDNCCDGIPRRVAEFQAVLDAAKIPLKLIPGGEMNFRVDLQKLRPADVVTVGMQRRFVLIDIWVDRLPAWFQPAVEWLKSLGLEVILAHPERMRALQDDWSLIDQLESMNLLCQGNLQCMGDAPGTRTRKLAEHLLKNHRYFVLGSDLHRPDTLGLRLAGLKNAIDLMGAEEIDRLTVINPRKLISADLLENQLFNHR